MSILVKFWGGRQLYLERDRWSSAARYVEWRAQREELLIWVGRWHMVYTPAACAARLRRAPDGRVA